MINFHDLPYKSFAFSLLGLLPTLRAPVVSIFYLLEGRGVHSEILYGVPSDVDLADFVKVFACLVSEIGLGQLNVHVLVHALHDSVIGFTRLDLHHHLRVLGHFEDVEGELHRHMRTIFFVFSASSVIVYYKYIEYEI